MTRYIIDGEARVDKVVKDRGTTSGIYLPKLWKGRRVAVILLKDPPVSEILNEGDEPGSIDFFDVEGDE